MRRLTLVWLGMASLSCMPNGMHTSNYGTALAATAVAVGAVALHRAATGDCWGHCGPGLACDVSSGLCVSADCSPSCGDGEVCQVLSVGPVCSPDPARGFQVTPLRPISPGTAPAQTVSLPRNLPPGLSWSPFLSGYPTLAPLPGVPVTAPGQ